MDEPSPGPFGTESFDLAVLGSFVSGGLSVLVPFFAALTGALVAIAVAGWIAKLRGRKPLRHELGHGPTVLALALLGVAVTAYLFLPEPFARARGAVLALGLAPLWWTERSGRSSPGVPEAIR